MKTIARAVEKYRSLILEAERYIWKNPETGYKEYKTSAYMAEKFRALGSNSRKLAFPDAAGAVIRMIQKNIN